MKWSIKLELNPHDFWIGIFWRFKSRRDRHGLIYDCWDIYVCLVPCVAIHVMQGEEIPSQ